MASMMTGQQMGIAVGLFAVSAGSYETYYLHVGRWWPRLTPWRGSGTSAS